MNIRWHQRASQNVYAYIAADNPAAAATQVEHIIYTVGQLAQFPTMGHPGRIQRTREFVVPGTPYIVAYAIHKNKTEISILAILHGAKRWPSPF